MRLILTRPEEDSRGLAGKLRALGHDTVICPLLDIVANPNITIPVKPWAALVITSANGVRCLPQGALKADLLVITVGEQSAQAARQRGFQKVEAHGGDVEKLAAWIMGKVDPHAGPLLYATGKEISGDLAALLNKAEFEVERVETYQAVAQPLVLSSDEISACDGILLYSPRSAKLWLDEILGGGKAGVAEKLHHYCLSPAVAKILPQDWHKSVALEPTERALLQLLEPGGKGE